jgi:hypothetical protein
MKILGLIILVVAVSLLILIHKLRMKSKLTKDLGRPVKDYELTSLSSWMEATEEKKPTYKKYVPAQKSENSQEN